jgi:hypothetical protein
MVDVRGRDLLALRERMQQHDGIHSARKAYEDAPALNSLERATDGRGELSAPGLP